MATQNLTTGHMRSDGSETTLGAIPHPLDQLTVTEVNLAREAILKARGTTVAVHFRSIFLEEPPKKELSQFLDLEHSEKVSLQTPRPARRAKVQYDVVRGDKNHEYTESCVDIASGIEVEIRVVDKVHHASLTTYGLSDFSLFTALADLRVVMNSKHSQKLVLPLLFIRRPLLSLTFLKALSSPLIR